MSCMIFLAAAGKRDMRRPGAARSMSVDCCSKAWMPVPQQIPPRAIIHHCAGVSSGRCAFRFVIASSGIRYLRRRSSCESSSGDVRRETACGAQSLSVQDAKNMFAQIEAEVRRIFHALPQGHPLRDEVPMICEAMLHAIMSERPEVQQELRRRFQQGGVWLTRSHMIEEFELARMQMVHSMRGWPGTAVDRHSATHVCHAEVGNLLPVSIRELRPFEVRRGCKLHLNIVVDHVVVARAMHTIVEDAYGTCVRLMLYTEDSRVAGRLSIGASLTIKDPYLRVALDGAMALRVDQVAENVVFSDQSEFAFATNMPAHLRTEGMAVVFDFHLECDVLCPASQFFSAFVDKLEAIHAPDQRVLDAILEALQQILGQSVKLSMAGSMQRGDDIPESDFDVHFSHEGPAFTKQQKKLLGRLLAKDDRLFGCTVRQGRYPTKVITPAGAKYEVVPKRPAYFHYGRSDIPIFRLAHDRRSADQLLQDFFQSNAEARFALKALKWVSRSLDYGLPSFMLAHVVQHSARQFRDPKNVSALALYLVALDELSSGGNFPHDYLENRGALQALASDLSFPGRMDEERRNEIISQVHATAAWARQFASEWPSAPQCKSVGPECLRWIWLVKTQLALGQVAAAHSQLDVLPLLRSARGKAGCLVRAVAEEVRRRHNDSLSRMGVQPHREYRAEQESAGNSMKYEVSDLLAQKEEDDDSIKYEASEAEGIQSIRSQPQHQADSTSDSALDELPRLWKGQRGAHLLGQAIEMNARSEFELAARLFEQVADLGLTAGMLGVSDCYYHGHGVKRDYAQHVYWLRKVAAQPLLDDLTRAPDIWVRKACHGLGQAYWRGVGVPADRQLARKWLERAADLGSRSVTYDLGCFVLEEGETESARRYFERAAEDACEEGMVSLADMQLRGKGGPQDEANAVAWLRKACAAGFPKAHIRLAEFMSTGAAPDFDAAIDLVSEGIRLGAEDAVAFALKAQLHWARQEQADRAMPVANVFEELRSLVASGLAGAVSGYSATEEDALQHLRGIRPLTADEKAALRLAKRAAALGDGLGESVSFGGLAYIAADLLKRGREDEARPLCKQLADSGSCYADPFRLVLAWMPPAR